MENYGNLSGINICDNKKFQKSINPIFSTKIESNVKKTLVERDEIIKKMTRKLLQF